MKLDYQELYDLVHCIETLVATHERQEEEDGEGFLESDDLERLTALHEKLVSEWRDSSQTKQ